MHIGRQDLLLPASWTWMDVDWSVLTGTRANASGTDSDGWMYAFNWAGDNGYEARGGMKDCVRRRLWIRRRVAYTAMSKEDRGKELLKSSKDGEVEKVKLLLRAGVDIETKDEVRVRRRAVQL